MLSPIYYLLSTIEENVEKSFSIVIITTIFNQLHVYLRLTYQSQHQICAGKL